MWKIRHFSTASVINILSTPVVDDFVENKRGIFLNKEKSREKFFLEKIFFPSFFYLSSVLLYLSS